jgi:hypothetical protein
MKKKEMAKRQRAMATTNTSYIVEPTPDMPIDSKRSLSPEMPHGPLRHANPYLPQCALDTFRYPMLARGVQVFRAPDSTERRNNGEFARRHVEHCRR